MADLSRWFKLWCASVHDPDLDNLDIADFGRWAKLGAIIKEQGTMGKISLKSPARLACSALQVESFEKLIETIKRLPNINVSNETDGHVSCVVEFKNWLKYQEDLSTDRVRKFRAKHVSNETPKKRREEKRREESIPFDVFWNAYPRKTAKSVAQRAWDKIDPQSGLVEKMIQAVEQQKNSDQWKKDNGKFIPHAATWLNQKRWEDEPQTIKRGDPGL